MHSCVSEAVQRFGRRRGAQKGRDVQIHFSITQLTAPWENKSKKCATLKCVHAARDLASVNPVFWFSESLIIWLGGGRGVYWRSQSKQRALVSSPSPCSEAERAAPAAPSWQGTAASPLPAWLATFSSPNSAARHVPLPTKVFNNFLWNATHYTKAELNKKYSRERTDC